MSHKTFPKPEPRKPSQKWGVYRKYSKPERTKKAKSERPKRYYDGDPLLEPYRPGIGKVTPELYNGVMDRANGKCELCGNQSEKLEVHHVVGKKRKAHLANLMALGAHCCHKPPNGVEGNPEKRYITEHIYQLWCIENGYNEEETRFLLNDRLVDDWETGERIKELEDLWKTKK